MIQIINGSSLKTLCTRIAQKLKNNLTIHSRNSTYKVYNHAM